MEYVVFAVLGAVLGLAALYFVIYAAVLAALRQGRRDAWTETHDIDRAGWLTEEQRSAATTRAE